MSQNRVEVVLKAKDELSGVVKGLKTSIGSSIGSAVSSVATLTAAIGVSALALANLGSGLGVAMTMQTRTISSVYGLATVMGSTLSEARSINKTLTQSLIEMGDALPGVTEDYQKFADAISTPVALGAGGDMAKYSREIKESSKYGGLLAATQGVDSSQGAAALSKFLSGGSGVTEAFTADIFQKNLDFKVYLNAAQNKLGLAGKDFKEQLTNEQRIAVFNLAGSLKFTPEMIAAFGNTADTQIQAIRSRLFNPVTGIFGFLREVKGLDNRTALDTVGTFLGQIDKLSVSVGKYLKSKGINLDPMEFIGRGLDQLSGYASAFSSLLSGDGSGLTVMMSGLKADLLSVPQQVADGVNSILSSVTRSLKGQDPKKAGEYLGAFVNNLLTAFTSIRVEDVTGALNWGMSALSASISRVDWGTFGTNVSQGLAKAVSTFDWARAGELIDKAYFAVVNAVASFLMDSAKNIGGAIMRAREQNIKRLSPEEARKEMEDFKAKPNPNGDIWSRDDWKKNKPAQDLRSSLPGEGRMSSATGSVFAPVINLSGSGEGLQATADYILKELNSQFINYKQGQIA